MAELEDLPNTRTSSKRGEGDGWRTKRSIAAAEAHAVLSLGSRIARLLWSVSAIPGRPADLALAPTVLELGSGSSPVLA